MAYFLPHLTYCSTVWLHCGKQNADIIENLLPDNVRVSTSLAALKIALKTVHLDNECCSFCDQC